MIYKLCAAGIIIFSSAMLGSEKAAGCKKRIDYLEEMENNLVKLENEIRFTQTYILDAVNRIGEEGKSALKFVFTELCAESGRSKGVPLKDIWNIVVNKNKKLFFDEDIELVLMFADCFNSFDVEGQIKQIRVYSQKVSYAISRAREEYKTNGKLYRSISVCAGVLLSVLLF